ncbi:GNAT family N-acetyltransferase [Actinomarinicola tropica]|uniref:GNAT family N-acetyltransferase n=1 Tax=Actinomarinicola tropica TaxID=2789776 RepID=UPI001E511227|nr:GNAT family N-acetyltransferase [Actinomarinicola tropica]
MTRPLVRQAAPGELPAPVLYELLRLRSEVFVVEQRCAYQDLDGRDLEDGARHWWVEDDGGDVVATVRTLREPDGSTRLGRVVTRADARGSGLAADLIRAALAEVGRPVVISAQAHLARWYRTLGFEIDGELFVEDGIDHLPMRLR